MNRLIEAARRARGRWTGRIESLPILAMSVHSACNCRCVMCDIWKANAAKRDISAEDLERHVASLRRLGVRRVMLTGGEPLMHANLWALCNRLRAEHVAITLVTTGLLLDVHAAAVARSIDQVVVSIDGPPAVHDAIRRVRDGFRRVAAGIAALASTSNPPRVTVRSVVQRANHGVLLDTVDEVHALGVDRLSFLAADLTSAAFNRAEPWDERRQDEIAVGVDQLPALADAIRRVERHRGSLLRAGFVAGGSRALWRIHAYYAARYGQANAPLVRCNAPWVSAVLEPGDVVRPCFFHAAYPRVPGASLAETINAPGAVQFRRQLNVRTNDVCRRCVCALSLPLSGAV